MLKTNKIIACMLTLAMLFSMFAMIPSVEAKEINVDTVQADISDETTNASSITSPSDFSWDNANIYFLLTDRFYNGDTSNDHAYRRSLNQSGQVTNGKSDTAAFHGGDFKGITAKINEGYFDNLGVNALWISAPYEQIHGYCIAGAATGSFPHYSYHGYYALDFSQPDAAFGTEKEFEQLVDTAHEHGIRIVLDVVMNHVGYNTIGDMNEYKFGTLLPGWESGYYNATLTDSSYHRYIDYDSNASDWAKWWGTTWLRAGLAGYTEGSGDLEGCQSFLPDVRTESTTTVDIPQVLRTKWTAEGTLASKQAELNNYFSSTSKSKTVRNYLVYWLTQWVEKYGVDGFRCDTAKHVELASWKALKDQAVQSLQTWRKNNPTKPGADWDESFWMTGECYPYYLSSGYGSYYTQGGFDSMINFAFNDQNSFNASAPGMPAVGNINSTYADYAGKINTNDKFNVLTYLSSHDTRLCRTNLIYQGSAFQLLPGGIQIFYGDETNRPLLTDRYSSGKDHALRSDMNWSNLDQSVLQHWQKVGTFRKNHVAVGAGSHTSLSATSGAAFARTYNKNGVSDKIVACIGASANTNVTITLNGAFTDGTVLKNTYDNTTATVTGGKVIFNSGKNGTILLEDAQQSVTPTTVAPTTVAPTTLPEPDMVLIGDANLNGGIAINDAALIQLYAAKLNTLTDKQLFAADADRSGKVNVRDALYVQCYIANMTITGSYVGTKAEYRGDVPVPTTQPNTDPVPTTQPITDPIPTDPIPTDPNPVGVIKFTDNQKWGNVNAYFFGDSGAVGAEWPGTAMTLEGDNGLGSNNYSISIPEGATHVIFNNGSDQTEDILLTGAEGYYTDGKRDDQNHLKAYPWSGGVDPDPDPNPNPNPVGTVKFTDNQKWGNVNAYFFGDNGAVGAEWPGTAMTLEGDNGLGSNNYSISIPEGATHVIFNNGSDQTEDIQLGAEGYYTDGSRDGQNHLKAYPWSSEGGGDQPIVPTPTPAGTVKFTDNQKWGNVNAYFFAGSSTVGAEWPGTPMTLEGDNGLGSNNYSISIPEGATHVIFNNGSDQTEDIQLTGAEGYYTDGSRDGQNHLKAYSW